MCVMLCQGPGMTPAEMMLGQGAPPTPGAKCGFYKAKHGKNGRWAVLRSLY